MLLARVRPLCLAGISGVMKTSRACARDEARV